jgi:DNA-binding PadR family transcriptional regulator
MVRRPFGIEIGLLGFFWNEPMYGYQIHQIVSDPQGLGSIWHLKQSQLYSLLTKLEQDGFIRGEIEAPEPGRPPRRMFQITRTGKAVYQNWMQTPVSSHRLMRQEFMAKLYFAHREGEIQARNLVEAQRVLCQKWIEELESEKVESNSFQWQLHQYRIGQISADISWLEHCLPNL